MFPVHIAAAVLNQTPLDWRGNCAHIADTIEAAKKDKVQVLCLPELAITGYACEDAFLGLGVSERALQCLQDIIPLCTDILVCVGLPLRWRGALYNVVAIIVDAQLVGFYAKQHLAGDGLHYEPRWFQAWPAEQIIEYPFLDQQIPLGDIFVDIGGLRIGFEICEDAWVAQRPAATLAQQSLDIILNPSASHFAFGKFKVRQDIVREGSRALQATYVYTNLVGNEAGRVIFDGGAIVASAGKTVCLGKRFSLDDWHLSACVVDVEKTRRAQAQINSFQTVAKDSPQCIQVDYAFEASSVPVNDKQEEAWETSADLKQEEFWRAIALGLIDYVRKSHSSGFVISLSGGADSAAMLSLVRLAWDWGVAHFGLQEFRDRVGIAKEAEFADWCFCVYQRTRNSGAVTEEAATQLALATEARFNCIDVDEVVQAYTQHIETLLGRALNWQDDDIALQNIQARTRAPSVWMLANCLNALLLATSNRSEAAVGYATMDGDTCGGLSPLAGIDKAFLLQFLIWLEQHGPDRQSPIVALSYINEQQPTAELRPQDEHQTDEDDLMPYVILDAIERLAIRDKYAPRECFELLLNQFSQYDATTIKSWVKRFFQLWSRNQWKRERYAPSFHVDDENLDPKTWCRFPILSAGFAEELAAL